MNAYCIYSFGHFKGFKAKFKAFSQQFTGDEQCAVACLLSHGADGAIFGTDGQEIDLNILLDMLDNHQCPALRGKPRLVFIQACRGRK